MSWNAAGLRRRTTLLGAVIGLLIAMLRVSKIRLDYERLPDGEAFESASIRPNRKLGSERWLRASFFTWTSRSFDSSTEQERIFMP
jgi:hypothetical protein